MVAALHRAITGVLQLPDVRAALVDAGGRPVGNTPNAFADVIHAEHARYGKLINEAGVKLD